MTELVDRVDGLEYTQLLIIKDDFSHFVELIPCVHATAQFVAGALMDWFSKFGIANTWVSDQGAHFKNTVLRELNERLQAKHPFTLPYCPLSNGTVERVNRDVLTVFRALLSEYRLLDRQWMQLKPLVQTAINHTPVQSLGNVAPITVLTGLRANNPLDTVCLIETPPGTTRMTPTKINEIRHQLIMNLQDLHKDVIDSMHPRAETQGVTINFDVGDFVLVARPVTGAAKDKLKAIWRGPMRITKVISSHILKWRTYLLRPCIRCTHKESGSIRIRPLKLQQTSERN